MPVSEKNRPEGKCEKVKIKAINRRSYLNDNSVYLEITGEELISKNIFNDNERRVLTVVQFCSQIKNQSEKAL